MTLSAGFNLIHTDKQLSAVNTKIAILFSYY